MPPAVRVRSLLPSYDAPKNRPLFLRVPLCGPISNQGRRTPCGSRMGRSPSGEEEDVVEGGIPAKNGYMPPAEKVR